MKETTKRILSLVLAFVMVLGLLPGLSVGVSAAGEVIDAAIFCSDVHGNHSTVASVFNGIKNADSTFDPSTASFVGDTQCAASSVTSAAQGVFSGVKCYYAFGNHDDKGNYGISDVTGLVYGDSSTNYYIYAISENSMASSNPSTTDFTNTVAGLDQSKPLFIISHLPLHERRGDSNGAPVWYEAISAAAEKMDVFFFWAHNHTGDNAVDREAYYVPNDGTESITIEYSNADPVYPNFTYANAGYIDPPNRPARNNVATAVYIYSDHVDLMVCNEDGVLTGSYAVDVTVDRMHAATEPEETTPVVDHIEAVSNKESYFLGEELELTVYEVYTNGDKIPVEDYTISGYDSSVLGVQSVLVSYGDFTTSVSVNVVEQDEEPEITELRVTYSKETLMGEELTLKVAAVYDNGTIVELAEGAYTVEGYDPTVTGVQGVFVTYQTATYGFNVINTGAVTVVADGMNALDVTDVTGTLTEALDDDLAEGFVAYDIVPDNYNVENNVAVVSMPAPEGANAVYYWNEETKALEPVSDFTIENGKAVFTTNHFSAYVVGESTEITVPDPETATGSGTTTTTTEKEVYVLVSTPTAGEQYIIVNRNTAGSGYALKENTTAGSSITVKAAGNGVSAPYIETTDETIMWNATSGLKLQSENGGYYLRYSSGLAFSTSNSTNWTYSDNGLSCSVSSGWWGSSTYYLRYSSSWSASTTKSSVYFYEKQTVEVETTTTASGTYSIAGNPAELTKVVTNGSTAELGSVLTFTPTSGTATTTENPTGVTYTVVEGSDPNGVISGISGNTVTFSGNYGKALVKISYTTDFGVVTNYIVVNASEPTYTLDITSDGNVVTGSTISKKGVTASTTLQLDTKIQFVDEDGAETIELPEGATIEWHIPEEYHSIATVNHDTGLVSFKGVDGAFYVTATLTVNGKDYTVGVNISATTSSYSVPSDGAADFPEYPNEGAIRYDKTATAVGNFSQTGIAQVELSMTGVPYTTGSEIDVVMMLDITGSMDDNANRIPGTKAAAIAFLESIVINEDGSYNENRIGIYWFNKNGSGTVYDFGTIEDEDELNAAKAAINSFDDNQASGGTPYDDGLSKCQDVLTAAKTDGVGNNRQQFCVFMSDGVPTSYAYVNGSTYGTLSGASSIAGMLTKSDDYATRDTDYKYEYYSTEMKKAGVTVYTVGLGLENKNSAWSGGTATQCLNLASRLLNDISGPANETVQPDAVGTSTLSKQDKYFFSVEDATAATDMKDVFEDIAVSILQAATDVTVEDQINDPYTMIFDIPTGEKTITGVENDFYIEFGKYALDDNHERTTFTSVTKLYLKNTDGVLSAKDAAAPVFEQKTIGEKGSLYYWSTNASDGDSGISVTVSGTTYYFVSYGMESGYNMTSGAYANGTVDSTTNMSNDLVIATPYFVYNAATKMLYWTVDKLDTNEYVLRYFLYLDNSATQVGTKKETEPGSYLTNDHAYITYTNFLNHDCRQEFPKPQLTWNGAQVSYVFYLVNADGQPINKSGQVVDFANATFITDVYTEAVVWNKAGNTSTGTGELSANWLADDLLPDEYEIYDEKAHYALNVYENADGSSIKNQFNISGGTADEISDSLNERLKLATTTASISTTKVYNTKAGEKISAYGTYTSADSDMKDFDFANTTVAFAVVWQPRLVEDVVVVDYGLDVIINVVQNDILQNKVSGIGLGKDAYGTIEMNTGVSTDAKLGTAALNKDGNTISIENETSVRFSQGDMEFKAPVVFYYETPVEFWEGSDPTEGYMYSSVTVIPATTIYYEEEFITFSSYTADANGSFVKDEKSQWTTAGTTVNGVQAQDRPGASQISEMLDADNNYGYDEAYTNMAQFSMGSAAKFNVTATTRGEAYFTFYGTGFDVIGLTSNKTGVILVQVRDAENTLVRSTVVDTYYGYTKNTEGEWVTTNEDDNALYQVPVIEIFGLDYGQYSVKIKAVYNDSFNHTATAGAYDIYLDAIRIYDPTGNQNDTANDAYLEDGEGYPEYFEVRDKLIGAETFDSVTDDGVSGIVFIDGIGNGPTIKDYTSYGPNNEVYLAAGQAISFELNAAATAGTVDKVQLALKTVGGEASVKVYAVGGVVALDEEISTATDLYYDITDLNGENVVIMNDGDSGIVSVTNVKVTYTEAQPEAAEPAPAMFMLRRSSVDAALDSMVEEEIPEETVPEETVPEETVPDETVPEETVPDEDESGSDQDMEQLLKEIGKLIGKLFGWIFG